MDGGGACCGIERRILKLSGEEAKEDKADANLDNWRFISSGIIDFGEVVPSW